MASMLEKHSTACGVDAVVHAQHAWAALSVQARVKIIARLRHRLASSARELAETIPPELPGALHRSVADSLAAEVIPLLEACRFLEREAERILRPRTVGTEGRPFWLGKLVAQIERAPWGTVLVIAPANYPLLLAGVQSLQALAAGNAVFWKPAPGTEAPAHALRSLLLECGLPAELLTILPGSVEAATDAISNGADFVVFTGSAQTGVAVARQLAETLTPAAMELSGCDAVFILPDADIDHTLRALSFGMRFNGSATCMAPRRVFLVGWSDSDAACFESQLQQALAAIEPIAISPRQMEQLMRLLEDARAQHAEIRLNGIQSELSGRVTPTLVTGATPALLLLQSDIFVPVLSVMRVTDNAEALAANAACPYALTASIFGSDRKARELARGLRVGNIVINDLIVSTADPRIPFGGRRQSGYGVTRGAEGLLAMTTPRTIQIQHSRQRRAYEPTKEEHAELFSGLAEILHGKGLSRRFTGLKRLWQAARKVK
jgi:acyl-CoA reductase-like NAD-dependent aldehyde dehydrogenase